VKVARKMPIRVVQRRELDQGYSGSVAAALAEKKAFSTGRKQQKPEQR
jgi:hypothetical protein